VLLSEPVTHDGQFWLLEHAEAGWRIRPFAAATAVRLEEPNLSGTFAICQVLRHGIFVDDRLDVLSGAMNAADPDELPDAFRSLPDINFLMGDTTLIRCATIYRMLSARSRPLGICLMKEPPSNANDIEITAQHDAGIILREAMALSLRSNDKLSRSHSDGVGFARFFSSQDVVLLGPRGFFHRHVERPTVPLTDVAMDIIGELVGFEIACRDELDFR
jgi:hypothetical protein